MRTSRAALLAVAALQLACGKVDRARPAASDAAPRQVSVARAEARSMDRMLQVVGTLSAHDEAIVAAQVAGQIEKSFVDVGDRVRVGQKVAAIDTTSYQVLVRQTAATLARATARAENIAQNLKRVQQLQRDQIIPASELDQAIADTAQARADVQVAHAADAIARLNLERSQVKAPFDGAVAERIVSVGAYVAVGAPIVKLVKTDPLRLRLQVSERESPAVRLGQVVRVSIEGDNASHTGRIARIAPSIREADRVLQVEADVPNGGGLRAGLFARAQIIIDDKDEGIAVPDRALVTFAGLEKVVVVENGKAKEKTVTTGRRGDGWVEIVSGLAVGEAVAVEPAGLRTGHPVRVASPTAATPGPGPGVGGSL